MNRLKQWLTTLGASLSLFGSADVAAQDESTEVLIVAQESSPSNIDPNLDPNEGIRGVVWNVYDRLVTFDTKKLPDGATSYDYQKIIPALAESWEYDTDGTSLIFHLHKDATFHDGSPVTAHDVKWSLDRSVSLDKALGRTVQGEYAAVLMKAGGFSSPDQFIVVDDHTFKIKLPRRDKLSLPVLGIPVPCIINSKLAKQHATPQDPWATEWLKTHDAGGGAFKLESFIPGVKIVYVRNDDWKAGPVPKTKKVIVYIVTSPEIRKQMLEQKTIDVCFELPLEDAVQLKKTGKFNIVSVPIESSMRYLDMNVKKIPFNDIRVRQAVAYALPYEEIFKATHERGLKLFGAPKLAGTTDWPQATIFNTDLEKAKKLLAEANYPNGFKTDLYIDMSTLGAVEKTANLIQANLKKVGIIVTIHKVKGTDWGNEIVKKEMPMVINSFGSWLNYPDYFFFWNYHSQNGAFNTMSYQDQKMDHLIESALRADSQEEYEKYVKAMIEKALTEIPRIPLFQMYLDTALQPNVQGYVFWFFRQLSFTSMYKTRAQTENKASE